MEGLSLGGVPGDSLQGICIAVDVVAEEMALSSKNVAQDTSLWRATGDQRKYMLLWMFVAQEDVSLGSRLAYILNAYKGKW
jgi:hypothetical protein